MKKQVPSKLTWEEMQELGCIFKKIHKLNGEMLPYINKIQLYRYEKRFMQYEKAFEMFRSTLDTIVCVDFPRGVKSDQECINTFYGEELDDNFTETTAR